MPHSTVVDRQATSDEVATHAAAIGRLAADLGLSGLRLRRDGTVIVHTEEVGYRAVTRLSAAASDLVGAYVHVITDDVPGAFGAREM